MCLNVYLGDAIESLKTFFKQFFVTGRDLSAEMDRNRIQWYYTFSIKMSKVTKFTNRTIVIERANVSSSTKKASPPVPTGHTLKHTGLFNAFT